MMSSTRPIHDVRSLEARPQVAPQEHAAPAAPDTTHEAAKPEAALLPPQAGSDSVWQGNDAVPATYARFVLDPESRQVVIQIRDLGSNTIIRQIPPEETARLAANIRAYLAAADARRTASQQGR